MAVIIGLPCIIVVLYHPVSLVMTADKNEEVLKDAIQVQSSRYWCLSIPHAIQHHHPSYIPGTVNNPGANENDTVYHTDV